jgi:hypothetical protein
MYLFFNSIGVKQKKKGSENGKFKFKNELLQKEVKVNQ